MEDTHVLISWSLRADALWQAWQIPKKVFNRDETAIPIFWQSYAVLIFRVGTTQT